MFPAKSQTIATPPLHPTMNSLSQKNSPLKVTRFTSSSPVPTTSRTFAHLPSIETLTLTSVFTPRSFSSSGIVPALADASPAGAKSAHYFTAHATPEPYRSYTSFETNVPATSAAMILRTLSSTRSRSSSGFVESGAIAYMNT